MASVISRTIFRRSERFLSSIQISRNFGQCNMAAPQELSSASEMRDFLSKYDTLIMDCDGVVWNTDHVNKLAGIPEAIGALRKMGKKIIFCTNNSMHARDAYVERFRNFAGFEVHKKDVFGVAYAAAVYVKEIARVTGKVYVVGSQGMKIELDELGVDHFGIGPDPDPQTDSGAKLLEQTFYPDVKAVLVGFDILIGYNKMFKAASYLTFPDTRFVATNDIESGVTIGKNRRQPITGAILSGISLAAKRKPVVVGKPHHYLMDIIKRKHPDIDLSRTAFIGDSLLVDIQFAKNSGIDSLLVMSGATRQEHLQNVVTSDKPELQKLVPKYFMTSIAPFAKV